MRKASLENKLRLYSGVALGLMATNLDAQIIYTDIEPDLNITANQKYFLDLNNDQTDDFVIEAVSKTSNLYGYQIKVDGIGAFALGQNEMMVDYFKTSQGDHSYWPKALNFNDLINASQQSWINTSSGQPLNILFEFYYTTQSFTETFQAGHWQDAGNKYLGLRFKINANWHYGWARLDVDSAGQYFIIKDYAYDSRPHSQILAGEKENTNIEWIDPPNVVVADRKIYMRNETENYRISILSIEGKIILEGEELNADHPIELPPIKSGIYILAIRNKEKLFSKKIYIQ